MRVGERPPRHPVFGEFPTPRMAKPASLDLLAQLCRRSAPHRKAGLRIVPPSHARTLVEAHEQSLVRVVVLVRRPAFLLLCPGHVRRALSVARFAADADLGPCGGEAVLRSVVILAHAGRVALGAHEVPILIELGPMQHVVVLYVLIVIEMKPALAAFALG